MADRFDPSRPAPAEPYSPRRRTALVLTGTGTAGAYHAGVLRALHEAGVKLDIVAGRGIGVVGALFAAIDGGQRLWDEAGFWRAPVVGSLYRWRAALQLTAWTLALAVAIVAVPIAAVALGAIVFPIDFLARLMGADGASGLVAVYLRLAQSAFEPGGFPTWLPRLVVLVLGGAGLVIAVSAVSGAIAGSRRTERGRFWWRAVRSPLESSAAAEHCWRMMWDLVRGGAQLKQPTPTELGRRYTELLVDNLGQPGFRELLIVVHDLDAHRDLVLALVAEARRRDLIRRPTTAAADARRAEVIDLAGVGREYLADAVAAALSVPVVTDVHVLTFAPEAYWRGETHRLCDRPGSLARVLEELAEVGVEQAVIVTAAAESPGPHTLAAGRIDGRGRVGEYLQSAEAAAVRDATRSVAGGVPRVFTIRPAHNPIGPFDFHGGYDDRSDRRQPLTELMNRGYEDAYRQFIEPVVGASGDRVGQGVS